MPLGASITNGIGSSDGNGYRLALAEDPTGNTMRFVGSVRSETMNDNYNEGHPGATIRETAEFARASLSDAIERLHLEGYSDWSLRSTSKVVPKICINEANQLAGTNFFATSSVEQTWARVNPSYYNQRLARIDSPLHHTKKVASHRMIQPEPEENALEDDIVAMLKAEAGLVTNDEVDGPVAVCT
ncbi:hypothetical protein MMC07_003571 [Pseudocyphellaria aurata]|nr:hypothetical protein [Pseudocyphellaria aurata]